MSDVKKIIVSKFATDDLNEIAEYYNSINRKYVAKIVKEFKENIYSLKKFPFRGRIVPELEEFGIIQFRELIQGNYRIVYKVENETITIQTIIDSRRNFEDIIFSKLVQTFEDK